MVVQHFLPGQLEHEPGLVGREAPAIEDGPPLERQVKEIWRVLVLGRWCRR
jgi:hypothetical protein